MKLRKEKLYTIKKVTIYPQQFGAIEVTLKQAGSRRIIRNHKKTTL